MTPTHPQAAATAERRGRWRHLARWPRRLSLFWRTFLSLVLLLTACILAWVQTFRTLEFEPQALQSARQVASLVNLTRAALQHADAIARVSLVKTLVDEERLRIAPREPSDSYSGYGTDAFSRRVAEELTLHLGPGTLVAREVNGFAGLWVGFQMDQDSYWLLLDPRRVATIQGRTWLIWLGIASLFSLSGAAVLARFINRPLDALSEAAAQVGTGAWQAGRLDGDASTPEIRAVYQEFNRMARQLARAEEDRQLMLAGISHDLRTPLARLRLEAEMSVPDPQAQSDMVADLAQVNTIIDKFLDYARSGPSRLEPVDVGECLQAAMASQRALGPGQATDPDTHTSATDPSLTVTLEWPHTGPPVAARRQPAPPAIPHNAHAVSSGSTAIQALADPPAGHCMAMADPVDLLRVFNNLLENTRRYGRVPPAAAQAHIRVRCEGEWVQVEFSDRGPGVDAHTLSRLAQPFFRGDAARSQASGAGLGLAVVRKMLERMGGQLTLSSAGVPGEGLTARVQLQKATQKAVPMSAQTALTEAHAHS
jgi:two-component system, OmpR family, osmolarity sensor histidine kinase EnvZ